MSPDLREFEQTQQSYINTDEKQKVLNSLDQSAIEGQPDHNPIEKVAKSSIVSHRSKLSQFDKDKEMQEIEALIRKATNTANVLQESERGTQNKRNAKVESTAGKNEQSPSFLSPFTKSNVKAENHEADRDAKSEEGRLVITHLDSIQVKRTHGVG